MVFPSLRATCALAFLISVATAPDALAHAHLIQQSPAADTTVAVAPQALTLRFSEGVEPKFSGVSVTNDKQQIVKTGAIARSEDKMQLVVPLETPLAAGVWQVEWHVVSVDGHKTKGNYRFTIK